MKTIPIAIRVALLALLAPAALRAAVPLRWTVETSRVQPAAFEAYQGETLTFEAALQSYGKPISNDLQGARIYWQTNGMGSAYWSASASAEGHVLRATWTPAMDVGARAYNCFIGSPSNSYRAAFQLRLRPSPGASPNNLQLPTPRLDFAAVEVANAPWLSEESDPTVPAWAKAATKPTYTADDVGALPLVEDVNSNKTAVTIGSRLLGKPVGNSSVASGRYVVASGYGSHAEGVYTTASGVCSHAEGYGTIASGVYSHAEGDSTTASGATSHASGYMAQTRDADSHAFAWNGDSTRINPYESHGQGTFNINPAGGLDGFYIGDETLASILTNKADKADVSATNTTFSNAVLAVGLNIDTNAVAVLNDIAETFGGFPIEGTATTVGGLLAALAAAVAWLKKNKADKATTLAGYGITDAATKAELAAKADKANTIPKYEFVTAAIADGVLTVAPYTNAQVASDGMAFTVAVAEADGKARDCQLTLDCTSLEIAPKITWPTNFHPRTDAETDFACVAGVRNVYWITEYAPNELVVAGWHETEGGTAE